MLEISVSGVSESPEGWGIRLTKNWESMDNWMAWTRLAKVLKRHKDADWQTWSRTGSQQLSHFTALARDRQEAGLKRQAFIGDLESAGFRIREESRPMSGHPYRESKDLLKNFIVSTLNENRDEYVVRGGSEILTRAVDSSPRDWQWEYFQKVLYFPKSSLVKKPRGPTDLQNYVFKLDGKLYAVDARRIYYMP